MEEKLKQRVGIFVGGGPAPGINGVIAAATIEARNRLWRMFGFYDGLRWLCEGPEATERHMRELRIRDVSRIHLTGGSVLRISRRGNVHVDEIRARCIASLRAHGIKALISIGGNGTAAAAARIADDAPDLRIIHVPKTIDNDIPLPGGFSTFGFQTARHHGVALLQHLMEDAKTTGRWYLVITMGRDAGHLALGIGKSAGATCTLIPEEYESGCRIEDIMLPIEGAIIRRLAEGHNHGVVVLAEGLVKKLDPQQMLELGETERTPSGEIKLSDLPLGNVLRRHLLGVLGSRGIDIRITTKVIGYELRCADPIPFDAEYTRDLGFSAMQAVLRSKHNGVTCRVGGEIRICPFDDIRDPVTGGALVRFVDTSTESYKVGLRYQIRMRRSDLEDSRRRSPLALAAALSEADLVKRFDKVAVEDGQIHEDEDDD